MNPSISFISGIIAAFTPCVLVLFPLLLYRFFNREEKQWQKFGVFILGFIISYLIFGYLLSSLFTSFIQNGIKIGFGILFAALGVLSFSNRLNPLEFPLIRNTFVYGATFALIVSINPCTLPYLGAIISISSTGLILVNILFFALGLILPAVIFAFVGKSILDVTKKRGKIFDMINHMMSIVLIVSGIYLAFSIKDVSLIDSYAASLLLLLAFMILIRSFFIIRQPKDLFKVKNILLMVSLILIIFTVLFQCNHIVNDENESQTFEQLAQSDILSCNPGEVGQCEICMRCITIFGSAAVIGILGIILVYKTNV